MSALCYASYSGGFQKIFLSSGEGQLLDVFSTRRLVATETGKSRDRADRYLLDSIFLFLVAAERGDSYFSVPCSAGGTVV